MGNYVVNLKPEKSPEATSGRGAIYERNAARAARFLDALRRLVDERGLSSQVAGTGEPMGFPIVTLTCTPEVARLIEGMPEVDSVYLDTGIFHLVP
jgi:hypothetical protein